MSAAISQETLCSQQLNGVSEVGIKRIWKKMGTSKSPVCSGNAKQIQGLGTLTYLATYTLKHQY